MNTGRTYKKASIRDVARLASVSPTTVSHVASGMPGYAPETVEKVQKAIKELNYVPSYVAKGLRQKSTRTIGVCAYDPYIDGPSEHRNFSARLWSGIVKEADVQGYKILHFPQSIRDSEDASDFLNGQIDGILMCVNRRDQRPALVAKAGLPVVMVARTRELPEGVGGVAMDEARVVRMGLDYLSDMGHERIAYLAGPAYMTEGADGDLQTFDDVAWKRLEGVQEWYAQHRPGEDCPVFICGGWEPTNLVSTITQWVRRHRITAILGANDTFAVAAINAAAAIGLKVPDELSVLGIDNDFSLTATTPSLSSIEIPVQEVGRESVRLLLAALEGQPLGPRLVGSAGLEVVIRDSTGFPPYRLAP